MTFAQRRNRLTTHFSEGIPVIKRCMTMWMAVYWVWTTSSFAKHNETLTTPIFSDQGTCRYQRDHQT